MSSFIDTLKASVKEEVVLKHDFLLFYNPEDRIVHAFFEGKTDESFYGSFLRSEIPSGWLLKTYICRREKISTKRKF